ncbi:MAG: hypothetical protein AAB971_02765 [Patescibacteria group bacterium]
MAKSQRKTIDTVFILLGAVTMLILLAVGGLAYKAHTFTNDSVHNELAAQKIYFPPKGSPGLDPAEFPDLQQYAGQPVDNGEKAKAYANGFIGRHLEKVANGQTYAEVSSAALMDPTNATLQQQKQILFQGETLRGLLLGNAYGYWMFGQLALYASIVSFVGAGLMALLVYLGMLRVAKA